MNNENLPICLECGMYLHRTIDDKLVCRNEICQSFDIPVLEHKIKGAGYEFEIRFIQLSPEKRAEWDLAMEILNEILLEALQAKKE